MAKIEVEIGDVQKTLFMPVWSRAVETAKKNPLLVDKTALAIIDTVDFDFSRMTENLPEISQIAWIARCKRFDLIVKQFIADHPTGTVVNIGCGLDTSYERINCSTVHWYDLDLPDVIDLKRKFQKETRGRKFLSCSFLDTEWFDQITVNDTILFIAAGVFVYFEEPEIRDFVIKVADRFDGSEMFFDVTSRKGLEIANQVIEKSGLDSRSFFKWALADRSVLQSWDRRVNLVNTYHTFVIEGLGLSDENKAIAQISDSLDIQYMVHLKISKTC